MKKPRKIMTKILAPCGLYCPECSFRVAYETQNRAHLSALPTKYDKYKNQALDECNCPACMPESKLMTCTIKECVLTRKLQHCAQCGEFPCKLINDFAGDGILHHKKAKEHLEYIREHGLEKFFKEKEKQIRCACGEKLSWYVEKCAACGKVRE